MVAIFSLWSWSNGSWIYNYLSNQCLSPLMLWVRISIRTRCTTLCDKICQWLATGRWVSPGPPVSLTNNTDCYNITEILLKVLLNTIKETNIKLLKWITNNLSMTHYLFHYHRHKPTVLTIYNTLLQSSSLILALFFFKLN